MRERNGVRMGQRVVDVDGKSLGRVVGLYGWGFAARWGLPVLWRRDYVLRYDEVRGVRDGALVAARSSRDLDELAAGDVPPSWRIRTPPAYPAIATPAEARGLVAAVARGHVPGVSPAAEPAEPPTAPVTEPEVRAFADTRGESLEPAETDRR
jgi:hypothetical protein